MRTAISDIKLIAVILCTISILSTVEPMTVHSSEEFYTVQTASFAELDDARTYYESVVKTLSEGLLDHLRIEKIGNYYTVRIGKFQDVNRAEAFLHRIKKPFPASIMRRAYILNERIKLKYTPDRPAAEEKISVQTLMDPGRDVSRVWISNKHKIPDPDAAEYEKSGNRSLKAGDYFKAAGEFRMAIDGGREHPVTYWKLAEALYELKFVDEAIVELEKAVTLSPVNDVLKIELAKLYLVKDRLDDARQQLAAALKINPCSADLHYYLGEVLLRMKEYRKAWYCAKAAQGLGYRSKNLIGKLSLISEEPGAYPWDENGSIHIRQILVQDYETAGVILKRISDGELFEDIADVESMIPGKPLGGYMGSYDKSELHPKILSALLSQSVFADPVIVETENGFHIVQRVANFDFFLDEEMLAGSE